MVNGVGEVDRNYIDGDRLLSSSLANIWDIRCILTSKLRTWSKIQDNTKCLNAIIDYFFFFFFNLLLQYGSKGENVIFQVWYH